MKIAVATDGKTVASHFGYCPSFTVFQADQGEIISREVVANPGHRPGFLPQFLQGLGIEVIISGGMGQSALQLFAEKGIQVVTGVQGCPQEAARKYLEGDLPLSSQPCR